METSLIAMLLANADLVALIGDRIHWQRRPQNESAYPSMRLQVISDYQARHMKGASNLSSTGVQVDIWGETYKSVKQVSAILKRDFQSFQGVHSNTDFQAIFINALRDLDDEDLDANNRLFRVSIDFEIWHAETT